MNLPPVPKAETRRQTHDLQCLFRPHTNGNLQADRLLGQRRINHGSLKDHCKKQEIFAGCQGILGKRARSAGVSSHPPQEQFALCLVTMPTERYQLRSRGLCECLTSLLAPGSFPIHWSRGQILSGPRPLYIPCLCTSEHVCTYTEFSTQVPKLITAS